jgi:hypothetical protein
MRIHMSRRHRTSFTPGLRSFISKVITPFVLVLGVLLLIFFNFNGVMRATIVTNNRSDGQVAFSSNALSYTFQENAGIDRPLVLSAGQNLLSYAEWSSTASVDGVVEELWNSRHDYDTDPKKNQVFSTISGNAQDWQLTEIVTLVNDHTLTVTFTFDARTNTATDPSVYIFDIAHENTSGNTWFNAQTGKGTFTAQVVQAKSSTLKNTTDLSKLKSIGTLSLTAVGSAIATPPLSTQNDTLLSTSQGSIHMPSGFITEYRVDNPTPNQLITLGTETLTFQAQNGTAGSPLQGIVSQPDLH